MTPEQERELEAAGQKWLADNDWDYQKYGDKRPNRDAYSTHMNYEISDLLAWAFESGARHQDAVAYARGRLAGLEEAISIFSQRHPNDENNMGFLMSSHQVIGFLRALLLSPGETAKGEGDG